MAQKNIQPGNQMGSNELAKLYCQLGLVLDGLWFLEVEKRLGFEKAYEIDLGVWTIYPRKEAKRIRSFMGLPTDRLPTFKELEKCIDISLFNQTVKYRLNLVGKNPMTIEFTVLECKSFVGMQKIGRTSEQIHTICKGIETATLENFVGELVPGAKIECLWCPFEQNEGKQEICGWKITYPL